MCNLKAWVYIRQGPRKGPYYPQVYSVRKAFNSIPFSLLALQKRSSLLLDFLLGHLKSIEHVGGDFVKAVQTLVEVWQQRTETLTLSPFTNTTESFRWTPHSVIVTIGDGY